MIRDKNALQLEKNEGLWAMDLLQMAICTLSAKN